MLDDKEREHEVIEPMLRRREIPTGHHFAVNLGISGLPAKRWQNPPRREQPGLMGDDIENRFATRRS